MAAYVDTFIATLRTAIVTHWTDVATTGVHLAEELAFRQFAELTVPFAVVDIRGLEWDPEYAAGILQYDLECDVYYVRSVDQTAAQMQAKLEGLRDYLYDNELSGCNLLHVSRLSWAFDLPLNREFALRQLPYQGGIVRLKVQIGEQ